MNARGENKLANREEKNVHTAFFDGIDDVEEMALSVSASCRNLKSIRNNVSEADAARLMEVVHDMLNDLQGSVECAIMLEADLDQDG